MLRPEHQIIGLIDAAGRTKYIAPEHCQRPESWDDEDRKYCFESILMDRMEGNLIFINLKVAISKLKDLAPDDPALEEFEKYEDAYQFISSCKESSFSISSLEKKPSKKSPSAPFTTSTLQQEASRKLNYSVSQTMTIAQKLYEQGFITYMRTDSVNLSEDSLNDIKNEITNNFGEKYYKRRIFTKKIKGAQEAHEAIRPSYISKNNLNIDASQQKLYDLIRKRTLASQMSEAKLDRTTVKIKNSNNSSFFVAKGEVIVFEGFMKVYIESKDDNDGAEKKGVLPSLKVGEVIKLVEANASEVFSRPPARYTEASLVKKMEELGIGPGPDVGLAADWLVQLQIQEGLLSEEEVKQKLHGWWNTRTT